MRNWWRKQPRSKRPGGNLRVLAIKRIADTLEGCCTGREARRKGRGKRRGGRGRKEGGRREGWKEWRLTERTEGKQREINRRDSGPMPRPCSQTALFSRSREGAAFSASCRTAERRSRRVLRRQGCGRSGCTPGVGTTTINQKLHTWYLVSSWRGL